MSLCGSKENPFLAPNGGRMTAAVRDNRCCHLPRVRVWALWLTGLHLHIKPTGKGAALVRSMEDDSVTSAGALLPSHATASLPMEKQTDGQQHPSQRTGVPWPLSSISCLWSMTGRVPQKLPAPLSWGDASKPRCCKKPEPHLALLQILVSGI